MKADIDTALAQSINFKAFEIRLKDMGYEIRRDERFAHYSVKAPLWKRIGNRYITDTDIRKAKR